MYVLLFQMQKILELIRHVSLSDYPQLFANPSRDCFQIDHPSWKQALVVHECF